jgi:hypothetical protein
MTLLAAVLTLLLVAQGQRTYSLMEGNRDKLSFVPYSPDQRAQTASTLNNFFSIYVHREKKIASYDAEYRKEHDNATIDPVVNL